MNNKIKELRLQKKITQDEMAESLPISQNAYSLIENGKTRLVDMERILLIAKKLGVTPAELGLFENAEVIENHREWKDNYDGDVENLKTHNKELIQTVLGQLAFKDKHIEDLTLQNAKLMQLLTGKISNKHEN